MRRDGNNFDVSFISKWSDRLAMGAAAALTFGRDIILSYSRDLPVSSSTGGQTDLGHRGHVAELARHLLLILPSGQLGPQLGVGAHR